MKPSEFAYHRPASLPDALALLGAHPGAKPLAGGQSLIPAMNFRLAAPAALVDLNQLTELSGIAESADGGLVIGAMTRHSAVERSPLVRARAPLLTLAMPFIAHSQIRSRGTLGGSLAHADPAAELPAVMLALDARLTLRRAGGERTVAAADFFVAELTSALRPGELLTEVALPPWPARAGAELREVAIRRGDFALGGAVATLALDAAGRVAAARIVCFGVGPRPLRVLAAEAALVGGAPSPELFAEAGRLASAAVDPHEDIHASAGYRRRLAGVLTGRALAGAFACIEARAA